MKPLVLVLIFSQLAFAQSDVGGIEPSSNYHPSLLELQEDAERGIPQAQYNLGLRYDTGDEVPFKPNHTAIYKSLRNLSYINLFSVVFGIYRVVLCASVPQVSQSPSPLFPKSLMS